MKPFKVALIVMISLGLAFSIALAENEGSAVSGKILFANPDAFGGTKACSACHPNGNGLEKAGELEDLVETINGCIVRAVGGKAIPEDSQNMKDMVAYIMSLSEAEAPGYGTTGYGSPGYGTTNSDTTGGSTSGGSTSGYGNTGSSSSGGLTSGY